MSISKNSQLVSAIAITFSFLLLASAEVFFEERFEDGWEKWWVKSDWKKDEKMAGEWKHTAGNWSADPNDKGIQTTEDYRFYAISAEFPEFSNKDRPLVFQFSVKREQKYGCAGAYMKLLSGEVDQKMFGGETPYSIMFGPDICGQNTKKVHAILSRNGTNHMIKKEVPCETDQLTHVYTLIIRPDATYSILIDNEEKESGSLYNDWDILPPKKIPDPEARKPEDWDDEKFILDPEEKKLEHEDSNDKLHGESEASDVTDPEQKEQQKQKKIRNPNYKGEWKAPLIDNPDYKEDPDIYIYPNLRYIGIELWQVKAGTLFDNIVVCDDPEYAKKLAEDTWGRQKDAEEEAFNEDERTRQDEYKQDEREDEEDADANTVQDADTEKHVSDEL
ncbi:calreticulin-like isoform X2 [Typha angustifolia]|uniref:calreticulin-like isoform X2 n=1 Tax=Typha angustifolia TaxID=59011 RepID=UPI003C2B279C